MDSWSDKQIKMMRAGGNQKLIDWFSSHDVTSSQRINQKYHTPAAELYRERLIATIEGRPLPTELPKRPPPSAPVGGGRYGGGFGNDGGGPMDANSMERLAGESDSEYIARQSALRDQASARMRDKFGGANRMQGIGSDATYNPTSGGYGSGSSPGGLSPEEIGGQIGQMGQKSMRFLSQSFSTLQTGVERTAHSLEEQKIGQSLSYGLQNITTKLKDPELTQKVTASAAWGWGAISTQANTLWSRAAETVVGMTEEDTPMKLYKAEGEKQSGSHKPMVGFGAGAGAAAAAAAAASADGSRDLGDGTSYSGSGSSGGRGWGAKEGSGVDDLLGSDWRDEPKPSQASRAQSQSPPPQQTLYPSAPPQASAAARGSSLKKTPSDAAAEEDDFFGSFGVK
ncbi:unnamed protein product [Ascophyllum nodosum]